MSAREGACRTGVGVEDLTVGGEVDLNLKGTESGGHQIDLVASG